MPDLDADRDVLEALLLTVGERGYGKASVREVAERARITQDRFHRRFGSKEACFARAYEEAAEALCAELLEACQGAMSWRDGFRAALARLLRFVAEQPLTARALLLEVKAARGDAWVKHQELTERLVAAIEETGGEPGSRPVAGSSVAGFVVGAIEETLCIEIATGRAAGVERLLPDLTRLAFLQLFGEGDATEPAAERRV